MIDELPAPMCWRCGAACEVEWVDVSTFAESSVIKGRCRCSNTRCVGRFDPAADVPPSPDELRRRADQALQRVRDIAMESP